MMLDLKENDKFYYDEAAGLRHVQFIEKYLFHYEDRFSGKPFLLLPWQRRIVLDLFGWKRRSNKTNRFKELFLECPKSVGKSPLITAIACSLFFCSTSRAQHIVSVASELKQADITFSNAKQYIYGSPALLQKIGGESSIKQYSIIYPDKQSKWEIMSGAGEKRAGFRINCCVADEIHEWTNRRLYDNMGANLIKRTNSLMLLATNSGTSKQSLAWDLHERAERVLSGNSKDETLYPVIYGADKALDWQAESTWKLAIPSLGETITVDTLRDECNKARESKPLEHRFRRLFLGQWLGNSADKWLDMSAWDSCCQPPPPGWSNWPLYVGCDFSKTDDMSAVASLFVGKDQMFARVRLWMPRAKAMQYEDQDGTPYKQWADNKDIHLLPNGVDDEAKRRMENYILKLKEKYKYNLQEVCYDRYNASTIIARLEKKGIPCLPIKCTMEGISPATIEFERRIKNGTMWLSGNQALRAQAEHIEVLTDKFGNMRPVKEAATGAYRGTRSKKIDGIVATILAMARGMKHEIKELQTSDSDISNWSGEIVFV